MKHHRQRTDRVNGAMFNERTLACGLSLTQASAPLPAPKLIHNVFRSYAPGGSGLEFGAGLSPFSVEFAKAIKKSTRSRR